MRAGSKEMYFLDGYQFVVLITLMPPFTSYPSVFFLLYYFGPRTYVPSNQEALAHSCLGFQTNSILFGCLVKVTTWAL
jgi:hypothetical protein